MNRFYNVLAEVLHNVIWLLQTITLWKAAGRNNCHPPGYVMEKCKIIVSNTGTQNKKMQYLRISANKATQKLAKDTVK